MNFLEHKKELMKNPAFRKAYAESELEFQIACALIEARIKKGYTQEKLARKLKTKQSVISRVENAQTTPSLSFIRRLALVLDIPFHIKLG